MTLFCFPYKSRGMLYKLYTRPLLATQAKEKAARLLGMMASRFNGRQDKVAQSAWQLYLVRCGAVLDWCTGRLKVALALICAGLHKALLL